MSKIQDSPIGIRLSARGNDKTLKIAHRGASANYPENTLLAFSKAVELGAQMIELDVHLSGDGEIVVIHDDDLSRTTNGDGLVCETSWEMIQTLDAGRWKSDAFSDVRVPRLGDVFEQLRNGVFYNVELKGTPKNANGLAEKVLKEVQNHEMAGFVVFSSFNHEALAHMRSLSKEVALGALFGGRLWPAFDMAKELNLQSMHIDVASVDEAYTRLAHEHGLAVITWTARDARDVQACVDSKVDGIIVDDLALLDGLHI